MTYVSEASLIATSSIFIALAILSVTLRYVVRRQRKVELGADDWSMLAAAIFLIACCIILIISAAENTLGGHSAAPSSPAFFHNTSSRAELSRKWIFVFLLLSVPCLGAVKLSILFFYRRIFRGKIFDLVSWTLIGATVAWTIIIWFLFLFGCGKHINANYGTLQDTKTYCTDINPKRVGFAVTDAFFDLVILVLPIPLVLKLKMSVQRKLAVLGILLLGSLAIAASLFRMALFAETLGTAYLTRPKFFGLPTTDQIGLQSVGIFWSLIEIGVAVPVACLPTLRPLFHGLSPESVVNSIRSIISLNSLHSQQHQEPRGDYDQKSKTGNFEMDSDAALAHNAGFAKANGSHNRDPLSTNV